MIKSADNQKGFTLIEILVVVAILGILALVVFVALNPIARFQDSRNNTRKTNVESLLKAIELYQVDNQGNWPPNIPTLDSGDISGGVPKCQPALSSATAVCQGLTNTTNPGQSLLSTNGKSFVSDIPQDNDGNGNSYPFYVGETNDKQHIVIFSNHMEPGTQNQPQVFYEEN